MDQHKQVVEFNKADAILVCNIGSPSEEDWYYGSVEELFDDAFKFEACILFWWEWDVIQYWFIDEITGNIRRVSVVTTAGARSSFLTSPELVPSAAIVDRDANVKTKSTSWERIPPIRKMRPNASSL